MAAATDRSALLGSINHVLKTAFKEFYDENDHKAAPSPAPPSSKDIQHEQGAVPAFDTLPPVQQEPPTELGPESCLTEESTAKIHQIDRGLEDCRVRAEDLLHYLTVQHEKAKVEDEVEADELKKEGILVHAHIPIGPSHLQLDQQVLHSFGNLGDHLLNAHDLVEANHIAMLRRSGRIPVAEGIKKFNLKELMYVEPHYYQTTSNLELRKELTLVNSHGPHGDKYIPNQQEEDDTQTHPQPRVEEDNNQSDDEARPESSSVRIQDAKEQDSEQAALDDIIRTRMASKLDFLKNPRYVKKSRTYQRSLVARVQEKELGYMTAPLPEQPTHHFECSPWPLLYEEYEVGQPYEAVLTIRNITAVKRSFRVLPPTTKYFSIVSITYPDDKHRDVAPGISVLCRVRFIPDALANYEDELVVVCESGEIHVPIVACRVHPCLTLPDQINVGECLVGDYLRTSFEVVNLGGAGRFRLLTYEDYPNPRQSQDLLPIIQLTPFKIWPTEFCLRRNDRLQLNVSYLPTDIGVHEARLLLLGDDCSLREVVISASCTTVKLAVSEMEGVAMDYDALSQLDFNHLSFGAVPLGSSATKSLAIHNKSSVSIGYEWRWLDNSPAQGGLTHSPFQITPPSGRLEPQGTMKFDIEYSPTAITTEQGRLAFVLQQIPGTCVPLPGQKEQLEELSRLEQYRLFRLENWCRAARMVNDGDMPRGVLERELFGPLLHGPHRYRILEVLDGQYETGNELISVDHILAQLPMEVKQAIESRLNVIDTITEEPMPKMDIESTVFHLSGSGDFVEVSLYPASHYDLPGDLYPGKEYSFEIEVENSSAITLNYRWGTPMRVANPDLLTGTNQASPASPREAEAKVPCSVVVEPTLADVAPGQRQKVKLTIVPTAIGPLMLRMPCAITGFPPEVWPELTVFGQVVPPRIRFVEPEVDFGLLSVEGKVVRTLSFGNESDVPLKWAMDQDFEGLLTEKINDGNSVYALSSARSGGSLYSRGMTDESGAGKEVASSVIFEPSQGMLQPFEKATVTITLQGGKMSERLRGRIACKVCDTVGGSEDNQQYLTYRGEIQELKVYLDKLNIDLGTTYVDVPVKRSILMTNVSNLTTKFKFEKPVEGSKNIDVTISPDSGTLSEKEVVKLTVTFVAKSPGVIDELYACRVFGMNHPIGFQLKTVVKGVVVSYEVLREGQPMPKPLAPPYEPQLPPGVIIPGAEVPPTLQFGPVPLFKRKRIRFIMRNLSAVPAVFRLRAKKYPSTTQPQSTIPPPPVFGITKRCASNFSLTRTVKSRCSSSSRKAMPLSRVDDTHERMDRFKSEPGREFLREKYNKEQDREILSAGNGLALEVTPNAGLLIPWGVTEVVVDSYNNMSGQYSDELECAVEGAPVMALTTKIKVEGCPLSLRRECVGLDCTGSTPIVQFGEVCSRDQIKSKTITVENSGPLDAELTWQVLDSDSKTDRIPHVAVTITCHEPGKIPVTSRGKRRYVSVKIKPLKVKSHPVYSITPNKQIVRGFREASFTVTMKTPVPLGSYGAKLVADAEWKYPRKGFKTMGIEGAGTDKKTFSAVRMLAETKIIHPVLALDKRKHCEKDGDKQYLKFEVASMEVHKATKFYLKGKGPLHPSMHRSFALTNPLTVPLTFAMDIPDPFRLIDAHTVSRHYPIGPVASSHVFTLGPHESVNLDVAFIPPVAKPSNRKTSDTAKLKLETDRTLTVSFNTGQTQNVYLRGIVLRPLLIAAPAEYSFGTVHVEKSMCFTLFISNPTLIEAVWKLVHVPSPPPKRQSIIPLWADKEAMKLRDDESVFSFSDRQGTLKGPVLPLKSSACSLPEDFNIIEHAVFPKDPHKLSWKDNLTLEDKLRAESDNLAHRFGRPIVVTFSPKLNVGYKSRFRFEVDSGEGFDVVFTGYGTYDEDSVPARLPHI